MPTHPHIKFLFIVLFIIKLQEVIKNALYVIGSLSKELVYNLIGRINISKLSYEDETLELRKDPNNLFNDLKITKILC